VITSDFAAHTRCGCSRGPTGGRPNTPPSHPGSSTSSARPSRPEATTGCWLARRVLARGDSGSCRSTA
jgi:hypothetical protein